MQFKEICTEYYREHDLKVKYCDYTAKNKYWGNNEICGRGIAKKIHFQGTTAVKQESDYQDVFEKMGFVDVEKIWN